MERVNEIEKSARVGLCRDGPCGRPVSHGLRRRGGHKPPLGNAFPFQFDAANDWRRADSRIKVHGRSAMVFGVEKRLTAVADVMKLMA